jgi:hypothetical protein
MLEQEIISREELEIETQRLRDELRGKPERLYRSAQLTYRRKQRDFYSSRERTTVPRRPNSAFINIRTSITCASIYITPERRITTSRRRSIYRRTCFQTPSTYTPIPNAEISYFLVNPRSCFSIHQEVQYRYGQISIWFTVSCSIYQYSESRWCRCSRFAFTFRPIHHEL